MHGDATKAVGSRCANHRQKTLLNRSDYQAYLGSQWGLATRQVSTSSGSEMKASKNPPISPDADVLAQEIVEDLEPTLEQFREIAADLRAKNGES
jgi:hypothetical protein